uniref:Reverse transcriptase domain-containing protein n=1 Tax=Anolis carolinensis TaxID=28377 RepID=A0A803TS93_ANOCA
MMTYDLNRQIKCISNNINGLNSPSKRKVVTNWLIKGKYDIVALQETHIAQKHIALLENPKIGKKFYSADIKKKRGVVLYIKEDIPAVLKFRDMEGRFVGVEITIGTQKTLICNIYAPNGPKTQFTKNLREQIAKTEIEHIMVFGDFNGILDDNMDKTKKVKRSNKGNRGVLPKNMFTMKKEFNLQDIWRYLNPTKRDYTFYSSRHQTWSRIDMVWSSNSIVTKVSDMKILARDKSDHSPIELTLNYKPSCYKWRLDENLIKSEEDINRYKELTKEFFKINSSGETKTQIIWDTYKAVMRGYLIQQKARKNRQKFQKIKELGKEIDKKENQLKMNPKNKLIQEQIKDLKKEKAHIELENIAKKLKFIKQDYFENANRPGAWLARKIRKKRQQQLIIKIKGANKNHTKDEEIIEEFHKFYTKLYKENQVNYTKIAQYLSKQKLEKISETQRELLNKEITEEEIKKMIKSLKGNKAPGPDGFSAGYYKAFQNEISVQLKTIMNQILQGQETPESWRMADIITIPKENSDTSEVKNYRPISLLNLDYKIFTGILANRFKKFLNSWISEEQTSFLPGRKMGNNIRCIVDIIEYYDKNHQKELALLSIDAEKAFDNLNWGFFKLLFKEIDIGYQFSNAIEKIYESQRARLLINGLTSEEIKIEKGTRQGCPLSPLIFIFAIEILLKNIKEDKELKGARIKQKDYKLRAFADDVICIIEEPRNNMQKWIYKLEEFGELAGFHLNKHKTKILTKNITKSNQEKLQKSVGITVSPKIKYLGIWLTHKNAQLLENNYYVKWKEISKDLENWMNLKISLMGRIALIKMNTLPKLLYLFQNLPIIRSTKIFNSWNKEILKFLWKGKRPRIKNLIMIDAKTRGGFGLPDLRLYFEASALTWALDWALLKDDKLLDLEGSDLRRGWHAYIGYDKRTIEKGFGDHFIRSSIIKVWEKYKPYLYRKIPMWISPLEANQRKILGWQRWPTYNEILIKRGNQLQLKEQEDLKRMYPNLTWFQYIQLKEQFGIDSKIGFNEKVTIWDKLLKNGKKSITILYNTLLEWSTETEAVKACMTKWARNIGRQIKFDEWEQVWYVKLKYTYATDLKENWLKIFHRWYITPEKLGRMYPNTQNKCWKCKNQVGSFYHAWWTCEETQKYWKIIHAETQKIIKKSFPLKPEYYLLGITDKDMKINRNEDILFTYLSTAARILYAKYWKTQTIPSTEEWIAKMDEIYD